jgi:hypothetical protein
MFYWLAPLISLPTSALVKLYKSVAPPPSWLHVAFFLETITLNLMSTTIYVSLITAPALRSLDLSDPLLPRKW